LRTQKGAKKTTAHLSKRPSWANIKKKKGCGLTLQSRGQKEPWKGGKITQKKEIKTFTTGKRWVLKNRNLKAAPFGGTPWKNISNYSKKQEGGSTKIR